MSPKSNLYDLVQFSKVETSSYWSGTEGIIGNTPQQGINWVGQLPEVQAVIIKTRPGSYDDDGWSDDAKISYHYSFKARNSEISYTEKANEVLVKQPQHLYPIFLFTEHKDGWYFEGTFSVSEIEKNSLSCVVVWSLLPRFPYRRMSGCFKKERESTLRTFWQKEAREL